MSFLELAFIICESLNIDWKDKTSWFSIYLDNNFVIINEKEKHFNILESAFSPEMPIDKIFNRLYDIKKSMSDEKDSDNLEYLILYNVIMENGIRFSFEIDINSIMWQNIYLENDIFFKVLNYKINSPKKLDHLMISEYKYKDRLIDELKNYILPNKNKKPLFSLFSEFKNYGANEINDHLFARYVDKFIIPSAYTYEKLVQGADLSSFNEKFFNTRRFNTKKDDNETITQNEFEISIMEMANELFESALSMNIPLEKMKEHFVKSYDDFILNSHTQKMGEEAFKYFIDIVDKLIKKASVSKSKNQKRNISDDDTIIN